MKNPLVILVGVIPLAYAVVAFVVVSATEVFAPESRAKFALLYALLAVVSGVADYFRMRYDQQRPVMVPARPFVRAVIRGHLVTLLFVFLGAGAAFLLDIDTGWPVVLGLVCAPVTGRALTLFSEYTMQLVGRVALLVMELGTSLLVLLLVLALVRGR